MNCVILAGYVSTDINTSYTQNENKMIANFNVACRNGKNTEFIRCVAWEKTAEFISKYFKKGSYIAIPSGRLQTRKYTDKDGKTVYVTEVIVEEVEFGGKKEQNEFTPPEDTSSLPF